MTKRITVPSLKPGFSLDLGPKDDVRKFEVVARTHAVDEAIDDMITSQSAELQKLEEDGADFVPVTVKVGHDCEMLNILLDPTDGNEERAGDLCSRLYEEGQMTSGQIRSISDQIKDISRPT